MLDESRNVKERGMKKERKSEKGFTTTLTWESFGLFISLGVKATIYSAYLLSLEYDSRRSVRRSREIKYELKLCLLLLYDYDEARRQHKRGESLTLFVHNIFIFIFESSCGDNTFHFIH